VPLVKNYKSVAEPSAVITGVIFVLTMIVVMLIAVCPDIMGGLVITTELKVMGCLALLMVRSAVAAILFSE
jgi:hypothetical protein